MKSKKVLIVEPSGNLWGSERVLLDFLKAASDLPTGFELTICYPSGSPIECELDKLPFRLMPRFTSELHRKSRLVRIWFMLKVTLSILRLKPDLIYVNQAGATRSILPAAWLLRIPVVSHIRLLEDSDYIASCYSRFFNQIYPIAISQFIYDALEIKTRIPKGKVSCLYDIYAPKSRKGKQADRKKNNDWPFVCIGRLEQGKGQDILLDALHVLNRKGRRHGVRFIGSVAAGSNFDELLESQCQTMGVSEVVQWCGYQSNVFTLAKDAIALICPSRVEALGRVVFEAWDMGLVPIVWNGSGGAAEIIQASGGGVLYEDQSGECLAEVMEQVSAMTIEERSQLVDAGRFWMKTHCSKEAYMHQMLGLWNQVSDN